MTRSVVSCDVSDVTFAGYTHNRVRSCSCRTASATARRTAFISAGALAQFLTRTAFIWAATARGSDLFRCANAAQVCSNVFLVASLGQCECSLAKSARHERVKDGERGEG
jgi:hypothetical protein